jgi:hypothetical protein
MRLAVCYQRPDTAPERASHRQQMYRFQYARFTAAIKAMEYINPLQALYPYRVKIANMVDL